MKKPLPVNGTLSQIPQDGLIDNLIDRIQEVIDKAPNWVKWVLPKFFKLLLNIVSELEFRKQLGKK